MITEIIGCDAAPLERMRAHPNSCCHGSEPKQRDPLTAELRKLLATRRMNTSR
jgi:hypothetical protein